MNVLICTIFRNSAKNIPIYFHLLNNLVRATPDVTFYYSAYENDSTDNTIEYINKYNFFENRSIQSEILGTKFFRSSTEDERVINLANARNKALLGNNYYLIADYILYLEADISYDSNALSNLLSFPGPFDILSGACYRSHIKENNCRDTWATRRTPEEEFGDFHLDKHLKAYDKYYSTFGGFCLYNSLPFKNGLRWSAYNKRKNKYDCDTAVICENFRHLGFDKIYMDYNTKITHWKMGFA